jgi:MarR family transcriptional regulator, transcriptional regulator for hemolysin
MESNSPILGFLLCDVARLLKRRTDESIRGPGLTLSQWRVLAYLAQHERINQNGLAEILEVEPITLCRAVDRLQTLGLIERHPRPSDRRVWSLRLAPAARPKLTEARKLGDMVNGKALVGIPDADRLRLFKALQVLKSNVTDASGKSAAAQSE